MLQTDSWVYLDLQKTGCTFLREKLFAIFPQIQESQNTIKHRSCNKFHKGLRLMTIRDPFDYYFSLWSYGVDGYGGLQKDLKIKLSSSDYSQIYRDISVSGFQKFLNQVMANDKVDLYTERVLRMILSTKESELLQIFVNKKIAITAYTCEKYLFPYFPDVLLPTDALTKSFHEMADSGKLSPMNLPANWKYIFPLDAKRVNVSSFGSNLDKKQRMREKISDDVDSIYSRCFLPNLLYKTSNSKAFGV